MNKNMRNYFKTTLYLMVSLCMVSCGGHKTKNSNAINTEPNNKYRKTRKAFYGKLDDQEYIKMIDNFNKELGANIASGQVVLINYSQNAPNCISVGFEKRDMSKVIDNVIRNSTEISETHNTVDFFVFEKDAFHRDLYESRPNYVLDSGFFYNHIFTIHDNCEAFYILKPNGSFMKYYGEDYYSEVTKFLEQS